MSEGVALQCVHPVHSLSALFALISFLLRANQVTVVNLCMLMDICIMESFAVKTQLTFSCMGKRVNTSNAIAWFSGARAVRGHRLRPHAAAPAARPRRQRH